MTSTTMNKRLWGMTMAALAVGMGCQAAPSMADSMSIAGGGGTTAFAQGDVAYSPLYETLSKTDGFFITQYYHKKWNPTQRRANNANCGPTSLAMAVRAFHKVPAGMESSDPAALIRYVRQEMTGSVDEGTWTYPVQIADGARRMGLRSEVIFGVSRIRAEMARPGRVVVLNLNPSPAYADKLVYPYDGGHFALLTAIDDQGAHIADPLGREPFTISLAQLERALTTPLGSDPGGRYVPPFNGGVLISE